MKVYVETNDIDVINDLFEATNSYECWACNRDDELKIKSLSDYTKQVRKEVCEEIRKQLVYYAVSILDESGKVKENVWGISKKDIDNVLDKMQELEKEK
jgi:hypothetical protein